MRLLDTERNTLADLLPGLDDKLAAVSLSDLERPDSTAIRMFRDAGGPALLVPDRLGGKGATPLQAARVHRAIGSRAPSLAVAATMHNFSIATLVQFSIFGGDEQCDALLSSVAENNMLVASGFAEGRSGAHILAATLEARPDPAGGYILRGSKRPCTLSRSMDLLTASATVADAAGGGSRRAVVMVPSDLPGIERRPFWRSPVLTGAESDELILNDVHIPEDFLFFPQIQEHLDPVEVAGYIWFQLLVSASYLGVATTLVERVVEAGRAAPSEGAQLGIEVEGAMMALEGLALSLMKGEGTEGLLSRSLFVRYAVQGAIERTSMAAAELLGGITFIGSSDVAYLLAAGRALAFHPPSRSSSAAALLGELRGQPAAAVVAPGVRP